MVRTDELRTVASGQVPSAATTAAYTAPVDKYVSVKSIYLFNTSGADKTVKLYVTDTPATPPASSQYDELLIKADGPGLLLNIAAIVLDPDESIVLADGTGSVVNYRITAAILTITAT